jgi:DNA-binding NarL/FixJ family response regulator
MDTIENVFIKIGIIEDNPTTRKQLLERLGFRADLKVTLLASNGEDAIKQLKSSSDVDRPELMLVDIGLPGISGIETTALILENFPDMKILIQTVFEDENHIFQAIQSGACGYLLKDDPLESYVDAIQVAMTGGASITQAIASKVLSLVRNRPFENEIFGDPKEFNLTRREFELIQYVVEDLAETAIAQKLFISPHTVRTHIRNIYKKLHVNSKPSMVRFALRNNLAK